MNGPFDPFDFWRQAYEMAHMRSRRAESEIGGTAQTVCASHILTMGEEGLVSYRGMSLDEIVSYGWVERAIDIGQTPDMAQHRRRQVRGPGEGSMPTWQNAEDFYQAYLRRREDREAEYEGWDPYDPHPDNPWNKEDD